MMSWLCVVAAILGTCLCAGCGGGQNAALRVAGLTRMNTTDSMVEFQLSIPTGMPTTVQLYLATTPDFIPTAASLRAPVGGGAFVNGFEYAAIDGLQPDTQYYVIPVFTAGAGNTQILPTQSFHTLAARPARVDAMIGDSITVGFGGGDLTGHLTTALINAGITPSAVVLNLGQSGTSSSDWTPTAGSSCIDRARNAIQAAHCTVAHIMLGTNDAFTHVDGYDYQQNLALLIAHLRSKCPTLQAIRLHEPPYRNQSAVDQTDLGIRYPSALSALADGGFIRRGSTGVYVHGKALLTQSLDAYHAEYPDDVHPNAVGAQFIAARIVASE